MESDDGRFGQVRSGRALRRCMGRKSARCQPTAPHTYVFVLRGCAAPPGRPRGAQYVTHIYLGAGVSRTVIKKILESLQLHFRRVARVSY